MTMTKHNRHMLIGLILLIGPTFIMLACLIINEFTTTTHLRWDAWPPLTLSENIFNGIFAIGSWTWLPALIVGIAFISTRNK